MTLKIKDFFHLFSITAPPFDSDNFDINNGEQVKHELATNPLIIGCLVNCSANGKCSNKAYDTLSGTTVSSQFKCHCNERFSGVKCEIVMGPCTLHPCMNGASCVDTINVGSRGFACLCKKYYFGTFCEEKINICENETCSSNGYCVDAQDVPKCQCFYLYSGEKCEIKSPKLVLINTTKKVSFILAAISLGLVAVTVVVLDLNCCKENKKTLASRRRRRIRNVNPVVSIQKPVYVNFRH